MLATSAGILAPARRSSNAINLKSQVSLETHQAACHFSKQYSRSVCTPPLTFPVPAQPCSSPQRTWSTAVVVHCWRAPLHTPQDPCAPPQAQPGDACTARSTDMRSPRAAQRTRSPYRNTQGRPHSDSNRSDSRPRKEHASLSLQRKPAQQGTGHMQDSQACYPATCSAGWHAEVRAAADQATCLSNSAATAHWAFPDASSGAGNKFDSNTGVWRIKTTPQNVRCSTACDLPGPSTSCQTLVQPSTQGEIVAGPTAFIARHGVGCPWHLLVHLRARRPSARKAAAAHACAACTPNTSLPAAPTAHLLAPTRPQPMQASSARSSMLTYRRSPPARLAVPSNTRTGWTPLASSCVTLNVHRKDAPPVCQPLAALREGDPLMP